MFFRIDGTPRKFVPIRFFREKYGLLDDFGVSLFAPKSFTGLGSIERAGKGLQAVRAKVLSVVPSQMPANGWGALTLTLQIIFRDALYAINSQVGLKRSEIEYAVAGFGDVCQLYVNAQLSAQMTGATPPSFQAVYMNWLDNSIQVSRDIRLYPYQESIWRIQLVKNPYGRVGLIVNTATGIEYVYDAELRCPAAGFMVSLLSEVITRLSMAMEHTSSGVQTLLEADRSAS